MAGTEPAATPAGRGRPSARILVLLAAVAAVVLGLDQLAKYLVVSRLTVGEQVSVLGDVLQLHYVTNSGAAFSFLSGFTWLFSVIAVAVIALVVWFAPRIRSTAWAVMFGLVLGGALGNASDRLFREPGFGVGHVVDFIEVWMFPAIFNVADIAITSSMCLFVLLTLLGVRIDGVRQRDAAPVER